MSSARELFDLLTGNDDQLEIELVVAPAINYALVHNHVPVLRHLVVRNVGEPVRDLVVEIELNGPAGELAEPWRSEVAELQPNAQVSWSDFGDFMPDSKVLSKAAEASTATLAVKVSRPWGQPLRTARTVRVLAHNEWFASPALYESIAAFVQPGTETVAAVLREASDILLRATNDSALKGYQAGPERAIETAGAIYEAIRARGVSYAPMPASFESTGQKVRTPKMVFDSRLGNCVDLSVAYAACLEQAGLRPLICISQNHAFAALHRDEERLAETVSLEPNVMINLVETGHVIPVEMTGIGAGVDSLTFRDAVAAGHAHFQGDPSSLQGMVDVYLAHRSGIHPFLSNDDGPEPAPAQAISVAEVSAAEVHLPDDLRAAVLGDTETSGRVYQTDDPSPHRVQKWKKSLLDLSLRNPLLNLPQTRGRGLDLRLPAGALAVLDDLVHDHKPLTIHSIDELTSLHDIRDGADADPAVLLEDLRDSRRVYGEVTDAAYRGAVRALQRSARTMEQETGSNYLYLTLGALIHPRPTGGEARAPLFLIPVRIEGGTGRAPYRLLVDGQELAAPNYCLIEWLRVKHDASIPQLEEPFLDDSGIDIARTLAAIKNGLVEHRLNYRVDEFASLRLLQFSTFQMWRDLGDHWVTFMENPVVEHLVNRAGEAFEDPAAGDDEVAIDEADLHLPIPADGSQMEAIRMAEVGRSFVLEGPPGTGKSQTITNLITRVIAGEKTLLFVAEKQAALDVVKRRIDALGLTPFVLDLHGHKQSMRSIRDQLKRSLEFATEGDEIGWKAAALDYGSRVAKLDAYPAQLHETNAAGFSAWKAYDALLAYGDGPTLDVPRALMDQAPEAHDRVEAALENLPELARVARVRAGHPWLLASVRSVDGVDQDALLDSARTLEALRVRLEEAPLLKAVVAGLANPHDLEQVAAYVRVAGQAPAIDATAVAHAGAAGWDQSCADALAQLRTFRERHAAALGRFTPDALSDGLADMWAPEAEAAVRGLFGKGRRQQALLAKMTPYLQPSHGIQGGEVSVRVAELRAASSSSAEARATAIALPGVSLPATWSAASPTATEAVEQAVDRLTVAREAAAGLPDVRSELVRIPTEEPNSIALAAELSAAWASWLDALEGTGESVSVWCGDATWLSAWGEHGPVWKSELESDGLRPLRALAALQSALDVLREAGMGTTARALLIGAVGTDGLLPAFRRGQARTALDERLAQHGLDLFDGQGRDDEVGRYATAADHLREGLPVQIASELLRRRGAVVGQDGRRFGHLKKQLDRKRGGMSFRELFLEFSPEILAVTPCLLMSPASVAAFLAPAAPRFDLAVFDEASQIRVPQAVGALGRARAAVIVGDSRQMPPTSVMEVARVSDDGTDEAVPEDLESILSEAVESGLEQRWLSWHYRSKDESLIAFSNHHYYDDKLSTLPSPGAMPGMGVYWHRVDGLFSRGRQGLRTNEIEAEAIVAEIARRLRSSEHAGESIGVVTFNVQQRDLILNLLEESEDALTQDALTRDDGEALFVKNLENVQGDERDSILFSLAFSKDPDTGRLPLNFGPLSQQGGERRLNVAITRARSSVVLFSSFDPKDIDLARTTAVGTAHLRAYLEMAADGVRSATGSTDASSSGDGRVLEDIASALEARELEVARRVGLSEFTVDLAVRAPGRERWQVAVLLDGPGWATRPTVADRDGAPRLLPALMGWSAYAMVWLPEWIRDREAVVERIVGLVGQAEERESEPHDATEEDRRVPDHGPRTVPEVFAGDERAGAAGPLQMGDRVADRSPNDVDAADPVAEEVGAASAPTLPPVQGAPFHPFKSRDVGSMADIDMLDRSERVQGLVRAILGEIVEHEAPIQVERLGRLAVNCFGFSRVSADRVSAVRAFVPRERCVSTELGTFVWPDGARASEWRGFRTTQVSNDRQFAEICPEEIGNAMLHVLVMAPNRMTEDDLFRKALAALGYRKLTEGILGRLINALHIAIHAGKVVGAGDEQYRPGA